jgi:membrane-associated phospholipid phosphatase
MIGASRVLLEIHSLPEVILGLCIFAVSLILFGLIDRRSHHAEVWPLLVTVVMLMVPLHGQELMHKNYPTGLLGVYTITVV